MTNGKKVRSRRAARGAVRRDTPLAPLPLKWLAGTDWCLPSGHALAEFALRAGFLAPLLMRSPRRVSGETR